MPTSGSAWRPRRWWGPPLGAAAGAGAGYVLFAVALRTGELSFISPFRYAGVPAAMLLGLLVWGDVPGWRTLLGASIIVGSGLFILRRERSLTPLPAPP